MHACVVVYPIVAEVVHLAKYTKRPLTHTPLSTWPTAVYASRLGLAYSPQWVKWELGFGFFFRVIWNLRFLSRDLQTNLAFL